MSNIQDKVQRPRGTLQLRDDYSDELETLHSYYTIPLAFRPRLVSSLLEELNANSGHLVLDPFCGTGTTLVECRIRGINSIGIDANPVCVLASRAKGDWSLEPAHVRRELSKVIHRVKVNYRTFARAGVRARRQGVRKGALGHPLFHQLEEGRYLISSGLVKRGWISPTRALVALMLMREVKEVQDLSIRRFLQAGFLGILARRVSNMKFGPEAYVVRRRTRTNVLQIFRRHVTGALDAIETLNQFKADATYKVTAGDSVNGAMARIRSKSVDFVITSPPYPAEHDYTRNTRLELVFGGYVKSRADLVRLKRRMVRCTSKGVYKDDVHSNEVRRFPRISRMIKKLSNIARRRSHGFARVYPRLVGEYFGDMFLHFQELHRVLKPGGVCMYVVGDQSSYFGLRIETARILTNLLRSKKCGFKIRGVRTIRFRHGTKGRGAGRLPEHVLIFEKTVK